jgi:hypothetical protein
VRDCVRSWFMVFIRGSSLLREERPAEPLDRR